MGLAAVLLIAALGAVDGAVYTCPNVSTPPVIDGKVDDAAWRCAPVVEFVNAVTGEPVTKSTKARMCWDDECLYVAWECVDQDIWGTYTKRDDPVYREEVVEIFACPTCDLTRYYEFNVTPRNTVFDAFIVNPDGINPGEGTAFDWNCKDLRTAVVVDGTLDNRGDVDNGYSVEIAIPFASLDRKAPRPGERWRVNLFRIDLTPPPIEFQAWSPPMYKPARFHVPDRFGTVFFSEVGE